MDVGCGKAGCDRPHHAGGFCGPHYQEERRARLGPCTVEDCARLQLAKGLCPTHLARLRKTGTVDAPVDASPEERFWAFVDKNAADGHWLWTGDWRANGYGRHSSNGTPESLSHRVAWHLVNGPIPDGMVLDHLCRERACVNPSHLEVVTRSENLSLIHI